MPLSAGTRLGPYQILAPIGAGGMGEVYRAHDSKLKRDVAVKVLPVAFANDPERLARFTREAQVLASLNHPNIAAIYGVEEQALIMELVEGDTLHGPLPLDEALSVIHQLIDALEYAHEKNIVHRDLKPANIKITPEGKVKVLDFGLAKALTPEMAAGNPASSPTLTMGSTVVGALLGTAAYMAPEQARGQNVDKRADIWAFGVVVYEMLTGHQLFGGPTISDTLAAVLKTEADLSGIPAQVRPIVERCLRKDPRRRWRDIGDVRMALDEPPPSAVIAQPTRRSAMAWSLVAILAMAAAAVSLIHFREKPPAAQAIRFTIPPPEKGAFGNWISVSPDGRKVAFPASGLAGALRIWVRPIDSLDAQPLAGTEGTLPSIGWSPDSRFLLFQSAGKLKKAEISGGTPQSLCDEPNVVLGGSWNREGVIIFGASATGLQRIPASGGAPIPLTIPAPPRGEIDHTDPVFLPDGRHFLYLRRSTVPENAGVYAGSLDAKPEQQSLKRIVATEFSFGYAPSAIGAEMGYLIYLRDGALMAQQFNVSRLEVEGEPVRLAEQVGVNRSRAFFSVSANGVLAYRTGGNDARMAWFDREGRLLGPVGGSFSLEEPTLSRDGTRIAYSRPLTGPAASTGVRHIWTFDILHGVETRVSSNADGGRSPVWSPDGSQIFYHPSVGPRKLYRKAASGAGNEELLSAGTGGLNTSNDWSSDGRFLMYSAINAKGIYELWVLPAQTGTGGERKPSPFLQTDFNTTQGHFSPDSRFVAYTSDESGSPEIYVRPFPAPADSSLRWKISSGGGTQPRWRRDGKELFYRSPEGLQAVEVTLAPVFKAGPPQALFNVGLPTQTTTFNYDVAPDGKRFLMMTTLSAGAAPITVVVNWTAGLNK